MEQVHISRLRLINFQKYADSVFEFGGSGNLVVGGNGSGKSTVAAAIALALGGNARTLGRSISLSEMIKYGANKAVIEVTIKAAGNEKSTKIARTITQSTSSVFKIDERPATSVEVKELTQRMGIYIDSLGQFLPQDRVTEFAELSPEEQLEITIKTCAPNLLTSKREAEKTNELMQQHRKALQTETQYVEETEKQLVHLESESKKMQELLQRKESIVYIEGKILWVNYYNHKKEYDSMKQIHSEIAEEYKRKMEQQIKQESIYNKALSAYKEKVSAYKMNLPESNSLIEIVNSLKQIERKIEDKKADIETVIKKREALLREMQHFQKWLQTHKENEEDAPIKKCLTEEENKVLKEIEETLEREKEKDGEWQVQTALKAAEIKNIEMQIKRDTEKIEGLKERLKQMHRDTYTAVMHIEQSKHKWDVELPAYLTLEITKEELAAEISSHLSLHALTSFVCATPESFQAFVSEYKERQGLAINVVERQPISYKAPPLVPLLPKYNMIYLSECISAPPAILEFLNLFSRLSQIPVTKDNVNETEFFHEHPKITRAIANRRVIEIKRSKYTTDVSLMIYPIPRGIEISGRKERKELKDKLVILRKERDTRREEREAVLKKREALEKRAKVLREKRDIDTAEEDKRRRQHATYKALKEKAEETRKEIEELKKEQKKYEEDLEKNAEEEKKVWKSLSPFGIIEKIKGLSEYSKEIQKEKKELEVQEREILAEKHILNQLEQREKESREKVKAQGALAKDKMREAEAFMPVDAPGTKERLMQLPSELHILNGLLEEEKAKIEISVVDATSIREYERCKEEIEKHKKEQERLEREEKELTHETKKKENNLRKELEELVKQIDVHVQSLFSSAGARVSVSVDLPESPRKWKLLLKVQFRPDSNLEILSSGRQSGGEKCVSIILYLLTMHRMFPAPFLIIDEINQGMDIFHEKTVHRILLGNESLKREQVIVITPKLIPGLEYSADTKVHLIMELPK